MRSKLLFVVEVLVIATVFYLDYVHVRLVSKVPYLFSARLDFAPFARTALERCRPKTRPAILQTLCDWRRRWNWDGSARTFRDPTIADETAR